MNDVWFLSKIDYRYGVEWTSKIAHHFARDNRADIEFTVNNGINKFIMMYDDLFKFAQSNVVYGFLSEFLCTYSIFSFTCRRNLIDIKSKTDRSRGGVENIFLLEDMVCLRTNIEGSNGIDLLHPMTVFDYIVWLNGFKDKYVSFNEDGTKLYVKFKYMIVEYIFSVSFFAMLSKWKMVYGDYLFPSEPSLNGWR